MTEEESERLGPWARSALAGFGLVVLIAALPFGYYCLIFTALFMGGSHGVAPRAVDWAASLSLATLPLLMLALGGFGLACSTRRRLAVVGALAAALVVDSGLALWLLDSSHRRDDGPPAGMTIYPDEESARKAYGFAPDKTAGAEASRAPGTASPCSLGAGTCAPRKARAP